MPTNTGNQGDFGERWSDAKLVERVEMGVMQYVILNKAQQGEVTKENLQQTFRGNLQTSEDHFDHCLRQLVSDGHLKEEGNKYRVTDDGREDIQKLNGLIQEAANISRQGAQPGQRQGQSGTQGQQRPGQPSRPL